MRPHQPSPALRGQLEPVWRNESSKVLTFVNGSYRRLRLAEDLNSGHGRHFASFGYTGLFDGKTKISISDEPTHRCFKIDNQQ